MPGFPKDDPDATHLQKILYFLFFKVVAVWTFKGGVTKQSSIL